MQRYTTQNLKRLVSLWKCTHRLLTMTNVCFLCVSETSTKPLPNWWHIRDRAFLFLWKRGGGGGGGGGVIIFWDMVVRILLITTQNKGMIALIAPPCRSRRCGVSPPRWNGPVVPSGLCSSLSFRHLQSPNIHLLKFPHTRTVYSSEVRSHGVKRRRQGLLVQVQRRASETKPHCHRA